MDTKTFLKQMAIELHKPAKKKFERRKVYVDGVNNTWAMDLADLNMFKEENDGYRYIFVVVDIFSRYAWAFPLKNKYATDVLEAFKKIKKVPKKIHCDEGSEWKGVMGAYLKSKNVTLYHTYSNFHAPMVESLHKNIKNKLNLIFTEFQTHRWIDYLDIVMKNYNETIHRSIQMTPKQAVMKKNYNKVFKNQYGDMDVVEGKPKFKLGDHVRISRQKGTFEKDGYNWSQEIFKVIGISFLKPVMYTLMDSEGQEITGSFYEPELQKTELDDIYLVEKIIQKKTVKGVKQVLVKWLGYPESANSWINEKEIKNI